MNVVESSGAAPMRRLQAGRGGWLARVLDRAGGARGLPACVLALSVMVAAALPGAVRSEEPSYDEFGRRPPQGQSDLPLPDSVLDSRWQMPAPGSPASRPETLDDDEERLDPLHDDTSADEEAGDAEDRVLPPVEDEMPASVEELLRRGPAGDGAPAPESPAPQDDDRGEIRPGDFAE